jgi:hypothetical protein
LRDENAAFSFGIDGLRALERLRVRPFLNASAAILVGVVGVWGCAGRCAGDGSAEGNGSVERNAWELVWWRVFVTSWASSAIREVLRTGTADGGAEFMDVAVETCERVVEEIDNRRNELG